VRTHFSATTSASKKYPDWKKYSPFLRNGLHETLKQESPEIRSAKFSIVFQTDKELLELNKKSLGHNFYTDIITFEIERDSKSLEAEIYISLDRAKENALRYKTTLRNELARLVIHGMLHLAGYDDKTSAGKREMRKKEKEFLEKI
jgi:probable rRNA maturation factor